MYDEGLHAGDVFVDELPYLVRFGRTYQLNVRRQPKTWGRLGIVKSKLKDRSAKRSSSNPRLAAFGVGEALSNNWQFFRVGSSWTESTNLS